MGVKQTRGGSEK